MSVMMRDKEMFLTARYAILDLGPTREQDNAQDVVKGST
jgi:hypothetical protein